MSSMGSKIQWIVTCCDDACSALPSIVAVFRLKESTNAVWTSGESKFETNEQEWLKS